MSPDLRQQYQRVREALEAAYAAPHWDSERIDRLADELARIERCAARPLAAPFRGGFRPESTGPVANKARPILEAVPR